MQKAYAYMRVSGRGQIEGDGFERQGLAIKRFAKANDVRIVEWFREEGVSGDKDLDHRPALAALVEALHSNGVKLVLIENLDRLARDLMVQESILHDLKGKGFEVVSVTQPDLCSNEPMRVLMRQMLGAFHQYEKAMIVAKLRGARERAKAKEGRCEGRKPYGYYEGEKSVIERMRTLRADGMGYDKVAAALNTEGLEPRMGGCWFAASVRRILLNDSKLSR